MGTLAGLSTIGILGECSRRGVRLELDGGRVVCRTSRDEIPDRLVEEMRLHKAELATLLADAPVFDDDRRRSHGIAVEQANAAFTGGRIDWQRIDAIADRIFNSTTRSELSRLESDYAEVVASDRPMGDVERVSVEDEATLF